MATLTFFDKLKKDGKAKFGAKPVAATTRKAATVESVRERIVANLHDNVQLFKGQYVKKNEKDKGPVACYKQAADGTYSFSIKYGVRNLEGVLAGETYVWGLSKGSLEEAFAAAVEMVNTGACDKEIERVMAANKALGAKRK